ncbi:HTH-type transcriptional regulator GltC [Achromobacter anxifer]|uniref:HTH-type transcriptional regulator GltC n=1 Tax=Achromobacter anxifer TaxID=1287737 RepID=A0A6S7F1E3_9BURK|nr:LysR family transcriptional regulator [Achromobacter anxifer]CAB3924322.1 HTH-type transcriptional regulator GltC [Achromobacter anxifer]
MELRPLRALVEVIRQGGFSQAAKAVFATQPTVSKAVRQLEDELGMPLLDRHAQPMRLTAAGEIVYRRAVAMLAQRDDLYAELDELKGLKRGVLRLGLPPLGSSTLFAPMFARFRSRYPQVEISLVEHGSRRLEEMVMAGEIELAASLKPVPDIFEWQPVAREPLVALMPADHPKARAESVGLLELRDSPFILFETGFALNRILHDACQRAGFAPAIAARSGQIDFIVALVAAGLGVAFLPRLKAREELHAGVARVPLRDAGTDWEMVQVWRRGGYLSHAAQAWLALTREVHPEVS